MRRFGLNQSVAQSHQEIGEWLGVGEERSRQIERESLYRLRTIADAPVRAARPGPSMRWAHGSSPRQLPNGLGRLAAVR
jgi:sigma-70-like protein